MSQSSSDYVLEILDESGVSSRISLNQPRMIVGRSPQVEVHLDCSTVSRQHAVLYSDPFGRWWIKDLGSRNGTHLNGQPVTQEQLLSHGDRIQIENFILRLSNQQTGPPTADDSGADRPATTSDGLLLGETDLEQIRRLRDFEVPRIAAGHLTAVNDFGSRLLEVPKPTQRLELLCQMMTSRPFQGRSALVLRVSQSEQEPKPTMLCEPASVEPAAASPYISRTVLRSVRDSQAAVLATNMGAQTGVIELSLAGDVDQLSAIACPIAQTPQTLDILYATFPGPYGTGEWLALVELAVRQLQQAEQAWQARQRAEDQAALERELERARRIQMQLVPRAERLRDFGELEIAYSFEPCHWVGGDYLDALQGPGGEAVLAVADVCGKGLQAALITACIHSMVYAQTQAGVSPEQMTQALNDYLVHTLPSDSFVTMVVLWWDPTTKRLKQMNAGHPPVFVANAQGELRRLSWGENLPLGMTPMAYQITDETLEPGEVMGIYTDGLSELAKAGNGPMLGTEGVGKLLGRICQNASGQPLTHLQEEFRSLLDDYQGNAPPGDDRTFLLARRR